MFFNGNLKRSSVASLLGAVACVAVTATSFTAHAQATASQQLARGWNAHIYIPFLQNLAAYKNTPARSSDEQARCDRFYANVNKKQEMKITLGIGYYDASEGEPFSFQIRNAAGQLEMADFGMNATIDIAYDDLYRELFTRRCEGSLQLCGFKEIASGVFEKKIKNPQGKKVRAVIEMRHASQTPSHAQNVGVLSAAQQAKSDATTSWFFGQVGRTDLLVYNGHSRKGGGPDFNPPKLLKNLHVNYAWYEKNVPGITRLTSALASASQKPAAVLMMSCNSNKLFSSKIDRAASGMPIVSTSAVPPSGSSPTKGALAGMDSFLRFQCEAGFHQELNSDSDTREFILPLKM